MAQDDKTGITVSDNAIQLFQQNPGLNFNLADIRAIDRRTLVSIHGCITRLTYQDGDDDLYIVAFDSGTVLTSQTVTNLNDFRQALQTAANFGFRVTACHYTEKKRLSMVNLHPCRCKCDDKG